jgi:hypothetical protein
VELESVKEAFALLGGIDRVAYKTSGPFSSHGGGVRAYVKPRLAHCRILVLPVIYKNEVGNGCI